VSLCPLKESVFIIDSTGRRIDFEGGPMWLTMRDGSYVNCHGTNGKGGGRNLFV